MDRIKGVVAVVRALLAPVGHYLGDESGYVSKRDGLSLAWLAAAVAGVAAVFGAAEPAAACTPGCSANWCGPKTDCANGNPNGYYGYYFFTNCEVECICAQCV